MRGAAKRQVWKPVSSHQVPQEDHAGCAQADPGLYCPHSIPVLHCNPSSLACGPAILRYVAMKSVGVCHCVCVCV